LILPFVLIAAGVGAYLLAKKKSAPVPAAAAKVVGHVQGEIYTGPDASLKGYTWNAATSHLDPPSTVVPHPATPVDVPKPSTPASAFANPAPLPTVIAPNPAAIPGAQFDTGPGTVTVGPITTLEGIMGIAVPTVSTSKDVQHSLNRLGYKGADGKVLAEDGDIGPNSIFAVKAFQKDHGLKVDGDPGPITKTELQVAVTGLGTADK